MTGRIFVVVTLSDVEALTNQRGQYIVSLARHSIDGTQIILDYNHQAGYLNSLFVPNPQAYFDSLTVLSHTEALELMSRPDWVSDEELT